MGKGPASGSSSVRMSAKEIAAMALPEDLKAIAPRMSVKEISTVALQKERCRGRSCGCFVRRCK